MLALGLAVAALAALLDQVSKLWVLQYFGEAGCARRMMPVPSFFDLVLTCNRGVSFGFFNQPGQPALGFWIFSVLAAIVVIAIVVWLFRVRSPLLAAALGVVIGGAIGDLVDRAALDPGVDFLHENVGAWYWPAFNLA